MRARRELLRTVLPPLLALGLVALLVRPVDAVPPSQFSPAPAAVSTSAPSAP